MRKINFGSSVLSLLVFLFIARPVSAVSPKIVITQLPEYIRENDFMLSYSALTEIPSKTEVQFYYQVDSGGYNAFGSVLSGASGQIQVNSAQVGESDKKYCFKAELISGLFSNETCTIYDQTPPGQPQNYSKERVSPSLYRIHWKNPGDDDFSRVFIYRGDTEGFSADGSHKIGELGGAKDEEKNWDDNGLDPNKEYYYALRSVDKAGNVSGLVGDAGVVYEETVITTSPSLAGTVVSLPKEEEPEGRVLPAETEAPQTLGEKTANIVQNIAQFAKDRTKITVGIVIGAILVIFLLVKFVKKLLKK